MPKKLGVFRAKKNTMPKRFADAQRVKNILRNTTGQSVSINLDSSATIFGSVKK